MPRADSRVVTIATPVLLGAAANDGREPGVCGGLIRRTPGCIVEPRSIAGGTVIGCGIVARRDLRRARLGVARTSGWSPSGGVGAETAFDEPYNIALQPAIGAPPAGRVRGIRRRCIRVGDHVTPAVDFLRALARAARG